MKIGDKIRYRRDSSSEHVIGLATVLRVGRKAVEISFDMELHGVLERNQWASVPKDVLDAIQSESGREAASLRSAIDG